MNKKCFHTNLNELKMNISLNSSTEPNGIFMKRRNASASSISKRICMIGMDSASREDATAILDLNDDCLQEVFGYFDLFDMCALVEVCTRLKQTAQAHYAIRTFLDDRRDRKRRYSNSWRNVEKNFIKNCKNAAKFRPIYRHIQRRKLF